jgi:hypothetical protein
MRNKTIFQDANELMRFAKKYLNKINNNSSITFRKLKKIIKKNCNKMQ